MVVRLEERVEERMYSSDLNEIIREPKFISKRRTAEDFGFVSDNYYTAEQKMQIENRKGGLVSGPFSKHLPS